MAGIKDFKQFFLEKPTEEMRQTETDPTNFTTTPNLTSPNTQMVSQNFTPNQTGWSLYPNGSAQFEALHIKDVLKTVPEDGDIQGAIDIISASGGGTVQLSAGTYKLNSDITGYSNVSIKGAGVGSTILDFQSGNYGLKYAGNTSTGYIENFAITDLTVKDADLNGFQLIGTRSGGIHIQYAKFFNISNVNSTGCAGDGLRIECAEDFNITNSNFDSNGYCGITIIGMDTYNARRFQVQNAFCDSNGQDGILVYADVNNATRQCSIVNSHAESNTQNGFYVTGAGSLEQLSMVGCSATSNGLHGFSCAAGSLAVIGCFTYANTSNGYYIATGTGAYIGNLAYADSNDGFNVDYRAEGARNVLVGNTYDRIATMADPLVTRGGNVAMNNAAQSLMTMHNVATAYNSTGATINTGEVVTMAASSLGYNVETTTIQGDPNVVGMALFDMEDLSVADILIQGKTEFLKVNGEEDIAVGDWLQTSTVAGVAMRASTAGQTVFAKALEAYTVGATGTTSALLVSPRTL